MEPASCLASVPEPGASCDCSAFPWYTCRVLMDLEYTTDPLRPVPTHADAACGITGYVGDPCSHVPLSGDEWPAVPAGPPHRTHCNHARCDGAVPPARPAGAPLPMPRAGSSSEDQGRLESGEAETEASDGQGQRRTDLLGVRKWQRVPGRQADHLCQRRVFQAGCAPGATDGSMPVGSVKVLSAPFPEGFISRSRIRTIGSAHNLTPEASQP